jgi:hypothetical protein
MSYLRIEPSEYFDKTIHSVRKDGYITYNYWGLVDACERIYDFSQDDAIEWVEYNILGLNDGHESHFGVRYEEPFKVRKVGRGTRKVRKVGTKVGKVRKRRAK